MNDIHNNPLSLTLQKLQGKKVIESAIMHLSEHVDQLNEELKQDVLASVPAFTESGNPDVLPDLAMHASKHTTEILRLLGGGGVSDFSFVREHARRRAEQRFPLENTLHAYRCGHKAYSRWLRDAALSESAHAQSHPQSRSRNHAERHVEDKQEIVAAIGDFSIEYTDAISTAFASAYVAQTRLLADVAGDQRAHLLNLLLDGYDESDNRIANLLRQAGYLSGRQSFCVALAQSVDPNEMQQPARARRLADHIDDLFRQQSIKRLIDIRNNQVAVIFSSVRRRSGWTAPGKALTGSVADMLLKVGNAALIGISDDVPSTAGIPRAYQQAQQAFELATPGNRVIRFSELSARQLLQQLAGKQFHHALPAWTAGFCQQDKKQSGALYATLQAYADADMNAIKAAQQLGIHTNTLYARFQRIEELSGLQARSFHALTDLLLLVECANSRARFNPSEQENHV